MTDIETLDVAPDAAILSIGACTFHIERPHEIVDRFLIKASIESNQQYGRSISASTLKWWMSQKPEALRALFEGEVTNLKQALVRYRMWCQDQSPAITHIWANDCDFDMVILKQAFSATNEMWPYGFWLHRSVRTIGELALPDGEECKHTMAMFRAEGTHHRADDDAIAQAKFVQHCYSILSPCAVEV